MRTAYWASRRVCVARDPPAEDFVNISHTEEEIYTHTVESSIFRLETLDILLSTASYQLIMLAIFKWLLLAIFVALAAAQSEVVDLDNSNFEKLTQAATGATTGDWLIKFYAPWQVKTIVLSKSEAISTYI